MLIFNENGNYYLKWAQNENTKFENTHMTQFSTTELEKYNKIGLDFHYELHFSEKEKFIRFDCNCCEYKNYKRKSKEDFFAQLKNDNHENLYLIRTELKKEFKKEFYNSKYKTSKNVYNYAYLLKYDLITDDYNDAIKESEKFINDTYDRVIKILKSVIN